MATVVNARDVELQAATPRVANVTIQPNLIVDQSQVDGLGIVVEGTKLVILQATTQVFQIAKTGTVSPASTTLTAVVRNIATAPTLSVIAGTITPAPTLSGGIVTISNTAMTTDTATLRLSVTENSITYTDELTLVKVREGTDSLSGVLTNESHTIPADAVGNPLSYTGCGGTFRVFQGITDITSSCTFALAPGGNPSGLTYSLGATTGVYSVTGGYPIGTTSTTLTMRATFGTVTLDKVFTIGKSSAGQRGSRTYYVALTGATNTYSDSLSTTTVTADGGPVKFDLVTQYNNSQSFSQTKYWDGAAWVVVNAVVDGNLIVSGTIGTNALVANAVTADKISGTNLSAIKASLGTVQIDSSGYLRTNGASSFGTGAGIWMGDDAGTYKLRVGNPAGNRIQWDGTNLTIVGNGTFSGSLSAATGTFAGSLNIGSYTGYSWPASGLTGAHLSSSGLLIGNANDGKFFQVEADGDIYAPQFQIQAGALSMAGGKFTVDSSGNAAVDTINIKRRIVLESGVVDPAPYVNGYYVDGSTVYYTPGYVTVIELSGLYMTSIYDVNSKGGTYNQPFFVQCWPQSGALRNWNGTAGSTFNFQYTAVAGPVRSFSNSGMYADDGRLCFQVKVVLHLVSGGWNTFQLPPIEWAIYRL